MSKFTPGPWIADKFTQGDQVLHVTHGDGDSFGWICRLSCNGNENAESDAQLIAAAPELLSACQAMVRYQSLLDSEEPQRLLEAYGDAFEGAEAAVAKATGEKS